MRTQHDSPDITVRATFFLAIFPGQFEQPLREKSVVGGDAVRFPLPDDPDMVFCADLLQNPDRPLFQLFVSGDFAVCENHRDDQIDTEVIQHHIAEPFHTASRRLPETVMSRPVFRSGGRKDLPDVALRFAIDQTGEKKLAGNQQRGQFGNPMK